MSYDFFYRNNAVKEGMSKLGTKFLCPHQFNGNDQKWEESQWQTTLLMQTLPETCYYRLHRQSLFPDTDSEIIQLTKEELGICSMARVLEISVTTLLKRILQIASKIKQSPIAVR